ncbi:sigma-70 family RNA polymerase sigma factor [Actinospica robiniae]|uniref:sigma-70 family RNA polymerase sigma factor n=1 Tax=Actinospica robiniae TaxID=304901 RepID=UPI000406681E|nr:sigma-70 family RNA polymerase sigma factor [Actinospica robiniae]
MKRSFGARASAAEDGPSGAPGNDGRADEARLRALHDQYSGQLFGYVLRQTHGDRQAAEDIVQETLLRAWTHPDALDPAKGSVRAWLFAVARNLVIDAARARQARPREVAAERLGEDWAASVPDPGEDAFERSLNALQVAEVLEQLSPEHRSVLVETYYRGATVAEAAKTLGVPPGTVKSRTYYALRALRSACAERGLTR